MNSTEITLGQDSQAAESQRDAEYRALKGLGEALSEHPQARTPIDALQIVADLRATLRRRATPRLP